MDSGDGQGALEAYDEALDLAKQAGDVDCPDSRQWRLSPLAAGEKRAMLVRLEPQVQAMLCLRTRAVQLRSAGQPDAGSAKHLMQEQERGLAAFSAACSLPVV
jgi:hypothetical protein